MAPGSGRIQCSSIGEYQNRVVGRGGWGNREREEGLWDFLREWGARKGEII